MVEKVLRDQIEQDDRAIWIGDQYQDPDGQPGPECLACSEISIFDPGHRQWSVAIFDDTASRIPSDILVPLISRMRDIHARRTMVILTPESSINNEDLIALGFHAMKDHPEVFYHDLLDYKQTPDWLNSHYWANPENWNRYRW